MITNQLHLERINPNGPITTTTLAVEGICAWPNLTLLPDGNVIAAVFNQPCHGMWEGDLDAYLTTDNGATWSKLSTIAAHDQPRTNRMNCTVGLAHNGDMIAIVAGWANRFPRGEGGPFKTEDRIHSRIYRSNDQGRTWQPGDIFTAGGDDVYFIGFGDIQRAESGRLVASGYRALDDKLRYGAYVIESDDDGHTWQLGSCINEDGNETFIMQVEGDHWIATSREASLNNLVQFTSHDNCKTWQRNDAMTLPTQVTGHLMKTENGRIFFSYGNRCANNYGVDVRISEDKGKTWGAPIRIADAPLSDCGYPSTVVTSHKNYLTAWYSQLPGEYNYAMFATRWSLPS